MGWATLDLSGQYNSAQVFVQWFSHCFMSSHHELSPSIVFFLFTGESTWWLGPKWPENPRREAAFLNLNNCNIPECWGWHNYIPSNFQNAIEGKRTHPRWALRQECLCDILQILTINKNRKRHLTLVLAPEFKNDVDDFNFNAMQVYFSYGEMKTIWIPYFLIFQQII